jgi:protein-tyrosine-phosphatase
MPGVRGRHDALAATRRQVSTEREFRVLVLCTGNSARSQIAEALFSTLGGSRIEARSAGSSPASRVHPDAERVLEEHGIKWTGRTPKGLSDVTGAYDLVITVCDNARDACPYYPGAAAQVHWGLPDPAAVRDADARMRAFRETYEALERSIRALLELPLESLPPERLAADADRVFAP